MREHVGFATIVGLVVGGIIAAIVHAVKQRRAHP